MFQQQARTRLRDKLDYEQWALNELESEYGAFPDRLGSMIIENERLSVKELTGLTVRVSQSRVEDVIQRLYPLIFAASYKCLDMIVEWILEENTGKYNQQWGYTDKNEDVNRLFYTGSLHLPPVFSQDPDIFERLLRLYGPLMDHRHAVVHRHDFEVANGEFAVKDKHGTPYSFIDVQLFSFAKAGTVSAEILLDNTMAKDQERELKHYLDNLDFVHKQSRFDIAAPWSPTIEYRAEAVDHNPASWEIDLDLVQQADDTTSTKGFYLKIVGKVDGRTACTWKIPSEAIPDKKTLELTEQSSDFEEYRL